jgi:hypothetical protein
LRRTGEPGWYGIETGPAQVPGLSAEHRISVIFRGPGSQYFSPGLSDLFGKRMGVLAGARTRTVLILDTTLGIPESKNREQIKMGRMRVRRLDLEDRIGPDGETVKRRARAWEVRCSTCRWLRWFSVPTRGVRFQACAPEGGKRTVCRGTDAAGPCRFHSYS